MQHLGKKSIQELVKELEANSILTVVQLGNSDESLYNTSDSVHLVITLGLFALRSSQVRRRL